jgi:hypothetical protein
LSCLSVCLSVRMGLLGSHWIDFHEIWNAFFENVSRKLKFYYNVTKKDYFTWRQIHIFNHISLNSSYSEKCLTKFAEKIETKMISSITFLDNRVVYETAWKNIAQPDRPQITLWRMRITCWIPKAKNTKSEYVIYITFLLQQWSHERASILHYTWTASLVYIGTKLKRVLSFMLRLFCRLRDALDSRLSGP